MKEKLSQKELRMKKRKTRYAKILLVLLGLSVFYAAYMFTQAPSGVSNKAHEYVKSDYILMILQCSVGFVVVFLPSQVEKRFGVEIPDIMEIIYFVFLFCAIYLGEVQNFYYVVPYWDNILHAFSAAMLGALGFVVVNFFNNKDNKIIELSPFFVSFFALGFATICGVIWEVYEYLADHILGTNMQKFMTATGEILTGHAALADTMEDIMINFMGALVIVTLGYIHLKNVQRKNQLESK